jgi:hypothetical protein
MIEAPETAVATDARLDVAAAWREQSPELAEWAWSKVVHRVDVWGGYMPPELRKKYGKTTTRPAKRLRGKISLTMGTMVAHFVGANPDDVLGLHPIAPGDAPGRDMSKAMTVDIDKHEKDNADPIINRRAAIYYSEKARALGFVPLLWDSNGRGGFHLDIFLDALVATEAAYDFLENLISDWKDQGLTSEPEFFPMQRGLKGLPYGNWPRLIGRHHTDDFWPRVYDPDQGWTEGEDAVNVTLATPTSDHRLIPPANPAKIIERKPPAPRLDTGCNIEGDLVGVELVDKCFKWIRNTNDYNEWVQLGMAAHATDPSWASCAAWDSHSRHGDKYEPGECELKWPTFNASLGSAGVGAGMLVEKARETEPRFLKPGWRLLQMGKAAVGGNGKHEKAEPQADTEAPAEEKSAANFGPPISLTERPSPKMPGGIFTGWLGEMIDAVSDFAETPIELAANFGLAAIAAMVQGKVCVRLESSYFEPLCLWTMTVMESGNRKTAVQREMCRPLATWEQAQTAELSPKIREAVSQRKTIEGRIANLRSAAGKKSADVFDAAMKDIVDLEQTLPEIPRAERLFTGDVTTEHLGTMMAENNERLSIISDEGGIFETMAGRYSNGIQNLDLYLQGHSAAFVRVDRGSRPSVSLHAPTLTMGIAPQPIILQGILSKDGFRARGFTARFLYSLPPSPIGYRELRTIPIPPAVAASYEAQLHLLARIPWRMDGERRVSHILTLDGSAWRLWKSFQRDVENLMREGQALEHLRDWGGKLPGAAARLAGLLHAADFASCLLDNREIKDDAMGRAITLARFYLQTALVVFDVMGAAPGAVAARALWKGIEQARKPTFKARDAWMPLRGRWPTVDAIEPGFLTLLDHNYLAEMPNPDAGKRGRPSRMFRVNPSLTEGWQ